MRSSRQSIVNDKTLIAYDADRDFGTPFAGSLCPQLMPKPNIRWSANDAYTATIDDYILATLGLAPILTN